LPPAELVVLNYHNHVPGPDPLTSTDSEERATFYQVQGTPAVFINGAPMPNVGGFFLPEMIEGSYRTLLPAVDHFLKTSTDVAIDAKAEAADGKLKVEVSVNGLAENVLPNVRLRLALVEENVEFTAPNGIRRHSMVVRTMLGSPKGISAKQGALKYSLPDMPLAELKARQLGYLYSYEQGKRMQFAKKPADLKPLHLVAFVQVEQPVMPLTEKSSETQEKKANEAPVQPLHLRGEILQAVQVPVTGELVYPDFEPPPGTATDDAESKPADAKDDTPDPATDEEPKNE
jgi:hypothetical protein